MSRLTYTIYRALLALPLLLFVDAAAQNKSLDDLNREKAKLQSVIEQNNKMMEEYANRRNNELVRISMIDNKIIKTQELIEVYGKEIDTYNEQIRSLNAQIDSVENEVKRQKDEYSELLRQLQLRGTNFSPLAYILSSESFNQSYRRFLFMRQYSAYSKEQFENLNSNILVLTQLKDKVSEKLTSINVLLAKIKNETTQLNQERSARKVKVEEIQKNQVDLQQQIMRAQKESEELEKQIVMVIKEEAERARKEAEEAKRKAEEERKRKEKEAKSTKSTKSAKTTDKKAPAEKTIVEPVSDDILDNMGNLPWPVRSFVITGYFGEREHPLFPTIMVRNNGIDIDILESKDIHPVHKGKVSRVIMIPGSTASVIIRHGEVLTVYSNLSEVNVKKDQVVDVYTNLGKVYKGAGINSNILHFEIWKGEQKQNPESWLKKL